MPIDKIADGDIALGDPGTFVEQPRCFEERRKVDLDEFAAHFLDPAQQGAKKPGAFGVAEIVELARLGDAETSAFDVLRAWAARRVRITRERVGGVEASRHGKDVAGVVGGERKDRDAIERSARRHDAANADEALCRLETDKIVERGWHAARPGGVGSERKADETGRDGDRRT